MATKKFYIINGPSKWDLMISLFDGDNAHSRRSVEFVYVVQAPETSSKAVDEIKANAIICSLSRNMLGGHIWKFEGFINGLITISGEFNDSTRRGHFFAKQ